MPGSKPGERRGGRAAGTPNTATAEAKLALAELARQHGPAAMSALVHVATHGENESARVHAGIAILDRGYGKPRQAVDLESVAGEPQIYVLHSGITRSEGYLARLKGAADASWREGGSGVPPDRRDQLHFRGSRFSDCPIRSQCWILWLSPIVQLLELGSAFDISTDDWASPSAIADKENVHETRSKIEVGAYAAHDQARPVALELQSSNPNARRLA